MWPSGDRHIYAPRTRFLPDELLSLFEQGAAVGGDTGDRPGPVMGTAIDVAAKLRKMWT